MILDIVLNLIKIVYKNIKYYFVRITYIYVILYKEYKYINY